MASAIAQDKGSGYVGDGYYRVQNKATNRFIYVTDNKDYYEISRDKEDFQAIQLWKDASKTIYNPATVIYVHKYTNGTYNLQAQGTGVRELTGYSVHVEETDDGYYEVYATKEGYATKYLSDDRSNSAPQGQLGTKSARDYRKWIVDKIETNSAINYFGIKPTIHLNGKHYQPFYAAFPFKTASPNMHVYYVSKVEGDVVVLKEIGGEIPASTPVVIECASEDPANNRLEILNPSTAKLKNNKLVGVYFCNGDRPKESVDAYKAFGADTMRVFTTANDKLMLSNNESELLESEVLVEIETTDWDTEEDIDVVCIPANTCYLKVNANTPATLSIRFEGLGLDEILADNKDSDVEGVYTLSGTQLRSTNDVEGLPAGVYIVGGVKVVIK